MVYSCELQTDMHNLMLVHYKIIKKITDNWDARNPRNISFYTTFVHVHYENIHFNSHQL